MLPLRTPASTLGTVEGETLDGRYRLARLLGAGGMGSVYEAIDERTGQRVAVKLIQPGLSSRDDDTQVSRFQREAKAASAVDSPYIVRVLGSGTDPKGGAPYLVMEHLDGEDLQKLLARIDVLPPDVAMRVAAQVCLGLSAAHGARVLHRDIKPANLFLARGPGGEITVKILDFGIAKIMPEASDILDTTGLTRTGKIMGTPLFMAPEQAQGMKDIDERADIWSLGVVLYLAMSGRVPHEGFRAFGAFVTALCSRHPTPLRALAPWVPEGIADVVHGALRISRADRFQSASAMLDAITRLLPGGSSLREEMLVSCEDASLPVDELLAGLPNSTEVMTDSIGTRAQRAGLARAALLERPMGGTDTLERATTDALKPVSQGASDAGAPARAGRVSRGVAVVASLVMVGAAGAYWASISSTTSRGPEASTAPAGAVDQPGPASLPASPAEGRRRRVHVAVAPDDVRVDIEGAPSPVREGSVMIEGALGSVHRVRLYKGGDETLVSVVVTEKGPVPPRIELSAAKPEGSSSRPARRDEAPSGAR